MNPSKAKLILAVILLLVAGALISWQLGLFESRTPPPPPQTEQATDEQRGGGFMTLPDQNTPSN